MKENERKCVLVIDPTLPLGIVANTAAILGMTIGEEHPEIVGEDVVDARKTIHPGIAIFGKKETVNALTGSLPLLR